MARRRMGKASGKTWAIRASIGMGAGLLLGFLVGAVTVRLVQPPDVVASDRADHATVRKPQSIADAPSEELPPQDVTPPTTGVLVPQLIGLEEGDARTAILRAGFAVGSVTFKSSPQPLGIVVESIPVPGEAVVLPATVSLILSDGKGRPDSLPPTIR